MRRMRFARLRRGGSSREKEIEVRRSCKYDSRRVCVCSGVSRKDMLWKMANRNFLNCSLLKRSDVWLSNWLSRLGQSYCLSWIVCEVCGGDDSGNEHIAAASLVLGRPTFCGGGGAVAAHDALFGEWRGSCAGAVAGA
jgi:hypothetical protein